jgi:hypothetical protein
MDVIKFLTEKLRRKLAELESSYTAESLMGYVNIKTAAAFVDGVSDETIRRWCSGDPSLCLRDGGRLWVKVERLLALADARQAKRAKRARQQARHG